MLRTCCFCSLRGARGLPSWPVREGSALSFWPRGLSRRFISSLRCKFTASPFRGVPFCASPSPWFFIFLCSFLNSFFATDVSASALPLKILLRKILGGLLCPFKMYRKTFSGAFSARSKFTSKNLGALSFWTDFLRYQPFCRCSVQ